MIVNFSSAEFFSQSAKGYTIQNECVICNLQGLWSNCSNDQAGLGFYHLPNAYGQGFYHLPSASIFSGCGSYQFLI